MKLGKRFAALLSAAAMFSALPANAASDAVQVRIDQVEISLEELAEMKYTVPVYVWLDENPGLTAIEYGVQVDDRCTYKLRTRAVPDSDGGEILISTMTANSEGPFTWLVWAASTPMDLTGPMAEFRVTVPKDAKPGDVYKVAYVEENYSRHWWNDDSKFISYVDEEAVTWSDGYIMISGDSELPGDVNCDGAVDILDVIRLNKNLLAGEKLPEQGVQNADVDGDSTPTAADALLILKYTIRLVDSL